MDPGHAAAQTALHLTPSRLHVTSEDNFWMTMLRAGLQSRHDVQACTSASAHPVAEHSIDLLWGPSIVAVSLSKSLTLLRMQPRVSKLDQAVAASRCPLRRAATMMTRRSRQPRPPIS